MAATAKGYSVSDIRQGPGDIWIIGGGVDDTAQRLTLAADGTPDSVAHPASICLGVTEGGITGTVKVKASDITVDQADAPVDRYVEMVEMTISAELAQQSITLLQNALSVGTYSTSSGYKQLTIGGTAAIPTACIALISPKRSDATKFDVVLIYKAQSIIDVAKLAARAKKSTHKVTFSGLADLARTAGRQIGNVYETV